MPAMSQAAQLRRRNENATAVFERIVQQNDPVAVLIATVRWQQLKLTYGECADDSGLSARALAVLENKDKASQPETFERIITYWATKAVADTTQDQLRRLLAGRYSGVEQFYEYLAYRVGHDRFYELLKAGGDFKGMTYVRRVQRRRLGIIPDYREPEQVLAKLYPDDKDLSSEQRAGLLVEADTAWTTEKKAQLEKRMIEPVLIDFLVAVEKHCAKAGKAYSIETMMQWMTYEMAHAFSGCRMWPWRKEVGEMAVRMGLATDDTIGEFEEAWTLAASVEQPRDQFGRLFKTARDAQGITNVQLAAWLNVEEARRGDKGDRKSSVSTEVTAPVRYVIDTACASEHAPASVLVSLVERPDVLLGADQKTEGDCMRAAFRSARADHYRRTGSEIWSEGRNTEGLRLRVERDLAGLSAEDVAWQMVDETGEHVRLQALIVQLEAGDNPVKKRNPELAEARRALAALSHAMRERRDRMLDIEAGNIAFVEGGRAPHSPGTGTGTRQAQHVKRGELGRIGNAIQAVAKAKLAAARQRQAEEKNVPAALAEFTSVADGVQKLADHFGGFSSLEAVVRTANGIAAKVRDPNAFTAERGSGIVAGTTFISLPLLVSMLESVGKGQNWKLRTQNAAMERHWYGDYAAYLEKRATHPVALVLPRALEVIVAANATTQEAFAKHLPYDSSNLSQLLVHLREGKTSKWSSVAPILKAGGFVPPHPYALIVQRLIEGEKPHDVLCSLLRRLDQHHKEVVGPQHVPGFTAVELEAARTVVGVAAEFDAQPAAVTLGGIPKPDEAEIERWFAEEEVGLRGTFSNYRGVVVTAVRQAWKPGSTKKEMIEVAKREIGRLRAKYSTTSTDPTGE